MAHVALTPAQVAAAVANAPMSPADRKNAILENQTYRSELPADSYRSALTPTGAIERFGYQADPADATKLVRVKRTYREDGTHKDANGVDVPHKAGDAILDRRGNESFEATGQMLEASTGAKVRMYDSVLNRLSVSSDAADARLFAALTGNGTHDVVFTGATICAIKQEVTNPERGYKQPRLIEA